MNSSKPNYFPKTLILNTIPLEVRLLTYDFGGTHFQSITGMIMCLEELADEIVEKNMFFLLISSFCLCIGQ